MNFQEGAFIYINKPYRMSSFGASCEAGEDGACRNARSVGYGCADPLYG